MSKLNALLEARFTSHVLRNYSEGWRRTESRASRFESRVLTNFMSAKLPEVLSVRAAVVDAPAEILLYDEIGFWGVTAKDFVLALAQIGDVPMKLRINSPGGDVFDGLAIFNAIRARKSPTYVVIDGLAASAASFIAMAGTTVEMNEASMLMIHNAWGIVLGDRNDMLEMAAVMEKIDGQLAVIYAGKSGKAVKDISAQMDAETWFTSSEAKDAGLCDAIVVPAPQDAQALAKLVNIVVKPQARLVAAAPAVIDPESDADDDSDAATVALNQGAIGKLTDAIENLTDDDNGDASAAARQTLRAAATTPEWIIGADDNLPIDDKSTWGGPAATERMLDAAGFNGDSQDPTKARRGFLVYDHHNPKLKGSYKFPFADLVGGELKAYKSGIDAAAGRLPDSDLPDDVKTKARAVVDAYEKRMKPDDGAEAKLRQARARLAAAQAA